MKRNHPRFQDLTNQTIAGAKVTARAQNQDNGNAAWHCRLACGHEKIVQGIALRAAAKAGSIMRCADCRPKRPGTVRRISNLVQ